MHCLNPTTMVNLSGKSQDSPGPSVTQHAGEWIPTSPHWETQPGGKGEPPFPSLGIETLPLLVERPFPAFFFPNLECPSTVDSWGKLLAGCGQHKCAPAGAHSSSAVCWSEEPPHSLDFPRWVCTLAPTLQVVPMAQAMAARMGCSSLLCV